MNTRAASVKLSFDRTKTELLSLKLRVTYQRTQRRFSFPFKDPVLLTEKDFERLLKYHERGNERVAEEIGLLYSKISPWIKKAEALCESSKPFSFEAFKADFYNDQKDDTQSIQDDLFSWFSQKIEQLLKANHIGTYNNYKSASQSLSRFLLSLSSAELAEYLISKNQKGFVLPFTSASPAFLSHYENWMMHHGKAPRKPNGEDGPASSTTVSMYARCVRTLFNDAIDAKVVDRSVYPFGRRRFTVPAGKNIKKALAKEDIQKIFSYQCEPHTFEARSRDFWIFSYLSNGMNFADILRLRWKNIDFEAGTINFIREKTVRTKKADQRIIRVSLFPQSIAVIDQYGENRERTDALVFPYISDNMSATKQKAVITQFIKMTNKHMRNIADALGIVGNVNTYASRHSFATILLHAEAPLAFISQALGHSNLKTTQNYLDAFDDEKTKKYLEALL